MDNINRIGYDALRGIYNVLDKIYIMTLFIVAFDDQQCYAELLFGDVDKCIKMLQERYDEDIMDFHKYLNLDNSDNADGIEEMKVELIKGLDDNNYLKSLYEEDEFALVIYEMDKRLNQMDKNSIELNVKMFSDLLN